MVSKLGRFAVVSLMAFAACSKKPAPSPEMTGTDSAGAADTTPPVDTSSSSADMALETIYFDFDSASINSDAQGILQRVAAGLKSNSGSRVQLEGHCDERGSNEYNLALGERRAKSVKEFLTSEGVAAEALSTISYGEEQPSVQGTGEAAWAKNRRVEMKSMN